MDLGGIFALIALQAVSATVGEYRSVSVDQSGRLHITLDSGKQILPPKIRYQVSFGHPALAPDRRTVGWLIMYPDPTITYYKGAELSGGLAVYRAGRVLHIFKTDQTFYDWKFQDDGKRVAYSTGPTHGGATECVLRNVQSGRVVAQWWVKGGVDPPAWARTLRGIPQEE